MVNKALFIFLLAGLPFCGMAQKAYETANYSGKLKGKTLTLKLANGYIAASEISLITPPKKEAIVFRPDSGVPDNNHQLTFKPDHKANAGFFVLKNMQDAYDQLPVAIYGVFNLGNQHLPVKLLLAHDKI